MRIGYAGFLNSYTPGQERESIGKKLKRWFWDYKVTNINHHTRSGYFLLRALKLLREQKPEIAAKIEINWWGMIAEGNVKQAEKFGVGDLVVTEKYFPKAESYKKLQACDLLFLPLETPKDGQDPLFIPGKLYEYLKFGKPILALGTQSDCVNILKRSGLAIICDPFNPQEVADQLAFLVQHKEELPERHKPDLEYIQTNFSFKRLSERLSDIFQEVLNQE